MLAIKLPKIFWRDWRRMNITHTPFDILPILPNFISSNQNLLQYLYTRITVGTNLRLSELTFNIIFICPIFHLF